jgi:hypothetical protein
MCTGNFREKHLTLELTQIILLSKKVEIKPNQILFVNVYV